MKGEVAGLCIAALIAVDIASIVTFANIRDSAAYISPSERTATFHAPGGRYRLGETLSVTPEQSSVLNALLTAHWILFIASLVSAGYALAERHREKQRAKPSPLQIDADERAAETQRKTTA
jgi:hypothetical protein